MKKVVQYESVKFLGETPVGSIAIVVPIDHPDTINVINGSPAFTTTVLSYDEVTEIFSTKNTIYTPSKG